MRLLRKWGEEIHRLTNTVSLVSFPLDTVTVFDDLYSDLFFRIISEPNLYLSSQVYGKVTIFTRILTLQ